MQQPARFQLAKMDLFGFKRRALTAAARLEHEAKEERAYIEARKKFNRDAQDDHFLLVVELIVDTVAPQIWGNLHYLRRLRILAHNMKLAVDKEVESKLNTHKKSSYHKARSSKRKR